jgi:hypothetical protein
MILTIAEKRAILKNAKTLLKLQKENPGILVPPSKTEKQSAPGVTFG